MTKQEIKTIRDIAYDKYCDIDVGISGVYDYANELNLTYSHCTGCDIETPTLIDENGLPECLICGKEKKN